MRRSPTASKRRQIVSKKTRYSSLAKSCPIPVPRRVFTAPGCQYFAKTPSCLTIPRVLFRIGPYRGPRTTAERRRDYAYVVDGDSGAVGTSRPGDCTGGSGRRGSRHIDASSREVGTESRVFSHWTREEADPSGKAAFSARAKNCVRAVLIERVTSSLSRHAVPVVRVPGPSVSLARPVRLRIRRLPCQGFPVPAGTTLRRQADTRRDPSRV